MNACALPDHERYAQLYREGRLSRAEVHRLMGKACTPEDDVFLVPRQAEASQDRPPTL